MTTEVIPMRPISGKKRPCRLGFFQVNLERLLSIPGCALEGSEGGYLGYAEMMAYIGAAAGVDTKKLLDRASTHGKIGIGRNIGMSVSRTERALNNLERAGYIARPTPSELGSTSKRAFPGQVTWLVDPAFKCNFSVSQSLLQPQDPEDPDPAALVKGTLAYLIEKVAIVEGISRGQAIVDAISVLLALFSHQDFDFFGGVDPRVAARPCAPIKPGEDGPETQFVKAVHGVSDFSMVTVRRPVALAFSDAMMQRALGLIPLWEDAPTLKFRFDHAISQLYETQILYEVLVLWNKSPIVTAGRRTVVPEVISTLYAPKWRADELEHRLSDATHAVMLKTGTISSLDSFGESRGALPHWDRSGIYRYIVPKYMSETAVLLLQLRVRLWAHNVANISALKADEKRVLREERGLDSILKKCLANQGV